jgi:hypothetical protein
LLFNLSIITGQEPAPFLNLYLDSKMTTETKKTYNPIRAIGRVPEKEWKRIKKAAAKSGKNFTQWALAALLKAAERV